MSHREVASVPLRDGGASEQEGRFEDSIGRELFVSAWIPAPTKLDASGTGASSVRRARRCAASSDRQCAAADGAWEEFGERFAALKAAGVATQRLLWRRPTKIRQRSSLREALITRYGGYAARDLRGVPGPWRSQDSDSRRLLGAITRLAEVSVDEKQIFRELEDEGVKKFSDSYDALLKALVEKEKAIRVA